MRFTRSVALALPLALATACAVQSTTEGQASYVKPADQGGQKVPPQEKSDDLKVTIALDATGTFEAVDALLCQLTSGSMAAEVSSTGSVDANGQYSASYDASAAAASSKSPTCGALKNAKITSLTSVTVQASMPANDTNCSGFCQAKADDACSASADRVKCTSDTTASCTAECKGKSRIAGSGKASASALADANGGLDANGNTTTRVDLVFDHLE